MGLKQSRYESSLIQNYYKLSSEEYLLIKKLWTEIENKPQYYGNLFFTSFLGTYPQYVKYYTLNPRIPLCVDVRLCAKFTLIMEAIGYLVLDVYGNRKQLDRLVGYVAMVHKDMRLDKEDMTNFEMSFLRYLKQTFPAYMTGKCQEAMTMYINSIVNGIVNKMEEFRQYEMIEADAIPRSSFGRCTLCTDNLVFGQTMTYWKDRKKDWDMLLNDWNAKNSSLEPRNAIAISDYDNALPYELKTENDTIELPELKVERDDKRKEDTITIIKPALVQEVKKTNDDKKNEFKEVLSLEPKRFVDNKEDDLEKMSKELDSWKSSTWEQLTYSSNTSPRERYRAFSIVRETIDPQNDPRILRRRLRSSRMAVRPIINEIIKQDDNETDLEHVQLRKFSNTARERRRESQKFSFDLK
ncbi:hypothetical protein M0802_003303 [Mischocyttarus mexicanus]|nr:hypothetical protein M0802_003303 [Mischocyttarus mexicanus]